MGNFPRRHSETAYRAVGDDGGLVVQPSRSEVQVLNPVGSKVYALLDGQHTVAQIVDAVVEEFDVSVEQAEQDVGDFLDDLEARGMLEAVTETGT